MSIHIWKFTNLKKIIINRKIIQIVLSYVASNAGDQGALLLEKGQREVHHFKVKPEENVVSVSGAGDCLAAGFIAGLLKGYDNMTSVNMGLKSARLSLQSFYTVPESLSFKSIQ